MSGYYDDGEGNPNYSYDYQRAHQGGYQRRSGFGYDRPRRRSSEGSEPRKSSGCKIKIDSDGNCFVNAWKKQRRSGDFLTLSVHYFAKSKFRVRTSDSGRQWVFVIGNVCKNGVELIPITGLLDITNKRCYFRDHNMIATTKGQGGYWGKHLGGRR